MFNTIQDFCQHCFNFQLTNRTLFVDEGSEMVIRKENLFAETLIHDRFTFQVSGMNSSSGSQTRDRGSFGVCKAVSGIPQSGRGFLINHPIELCLIRHLLT